MRHALAIGATVSIIGNCRRTSTVIERAARYRERRAAGISVERKHLLIERHRLRRWRIDRPRDGICPAQGQLLQDVTLQCRSWDGSGRDDWQCNANPLAIEEEKQLVVQDRAADAPAEVIHVGGWFVISWSGIREVVGRAELRAAPQLIQISVK